MLRHIVKRLKDEKKPVKFLWSRALWRSGTCSLFDIQRNNYKVKFFPTALSASLFYEPSFGLEEEALLKHILKPGDTFVDIGANIGHLSLFASTIVGNRGSVFSFEPHPKTFLFLKKNVALNKSENVKTFNYGLGDKEDTPSFSDSLSDDQNFIDNHSNSRIKVQVKRLDDCLSNAPIKLLKVDTEGYEKFVFLGAQETLNNTEYVFFETNDELCRRFDYSLNENLKFLKELKFDFYEFKAGKLVAFDITGSLPMPNNLIAKKTT